MHGASWGVGGKEGALCEGRALVFHPWRLGLGQGQDQEMNTPVKNSSLC